MDGTKTRTPAGKPDSKKREYAWHRHPALIAAIPAVFTLVGGVLTVGLGQADVLPSAINPAPPPTTILATTTTTATATATVTETVTETPTPEPTGTDGPAGASTAPTVAPGSLAITIRMNSNGKIGPGEYRAGAIPNAVAEVLDESGRTPDTGCYPTWVLRRGSTVVKSARSGSCGATFYLSSDSLEVRGVYHLTVSVVTDAGVTGSRTEDFKVT